MRYAAMQQLGSFRSLYLLARLLRPPSRFLPSFFKANADRGHQGAPSASCTSAKANSD